MPEEVQKPEPQLSPGQFLATFSPDAPDNAALVSFKEQVPGGRIKIQQLPDLKRVYVMRGLSGDELSKIEQMIPGINNLPPEKAQQALQYAIASRCTLWTNRTPDRKETEASLRAAGSGLAQTLNVTINDLSDYHSPDILQQLSIEI